MHGALSWSAGRHRRDNLARRRSVDEGHRDRDRIGGSGRGRGRSEDDAAALLRGTGLPELTSGRQGQDSHLLPLIQTSRNESAISFISFHTSVIIRRSPSPDVGPRSEAVSRGSSPFPMG